MPFYFTTAFMLNPQLLFFYYTVSCVLPAAGKIITLSKRSCFELQEVTFYRSRGYLLRRQRLPFIIWPAVLDGMACKTVSAELS